MKEKHFYSNLEDRLINFGVNVVSIGSKLQVRRELKGITDQILRSGISCPLNYAEAIHAESKKDFIHKMKIALKELRETYTALRILIAIPGIPHKEELSLLKIENNELLSIFVTSVKTAQKNLLKEKKD
ncbi:MAG: four helix bundle protein [Bacteroidales bacterium]|nr:four helix bundle protein [Bacteroidales bacterium]